MKLVFRLLQFFIVFALAITAIAQERSNALPAESTAGAKLCKGVNCDRQGNEVCVIVNTNQK